MGRGEGKREGKRRRKRNEKEIRCGGEGERGKGERKRTVGETHHVLALFSPVAAAYCSVLY